MTPAQKLLFAGQIVGWIQVALNLITYISTKRSRILALKLIADVCAAINTALTGFRIAGAYTNTVAIGREAVFFNRTKHKWANHTAWLFFFMGLMALAPVIDFAVRGSFVWLSLLPAAGSLIAAVGLFGCNMLRTKILVLIAQIPYLFYHMLTIGENGAVAWSCNMPGIISTAIPILSASIGICYECFLRYRMKKARLTATRSV